MSDFTLLHFQNLFLRHTANYCPIHRLIPHGTILIIGLYLLRFGVVLANLFRRQIHTVSVKNLELLLVIFDININKVSVGAFHFIKEAVALKLAVFYGKKITLIYLALGCYFFVRDCLNSRTFAVNIARIEQAVSMAS